MGCLPGPGSANTSEYLARALEPSISSSSNAAGSEFQRLSSRTPDGLQKCSRCTYTGVASSFPRRRAGVGYLKSCASCISKQGIKKAQKANKELSSFSLTVPTMSLDEYLSSVQCNKDRAFELDAFVEIPEGMFRQDGEHL